MKLQEWLNRNGSAPGVPMPTATFAKLIGTDQSSVTRYALGRRIPRRAIMRKIREVTKGKVTANDFLDDSNGGEARAA